MELLAIHLSSNTFWPIYNRTIKVADVFIIIIFFKLNRQKIELIYS